MEAEVPMEGSPVRRLDSLTSLRWFAATAVFLHHAHAGLGLSTQGATGVSFFFVLSGFVLSWTAAETMHRRAFYWRRFARIWPAFLVSSVLVIAAYVAVGAIRGRSDLVAAGFSLTLLQSWVPSQQIYFGGNGVSWSLSDEAFFYAVFPAFFLVAARLRGRWLEAVAAAAAALAIAAPLVVHPTSETSIGYWFVYINPSVRVLEFILGASLGILVKRDALPRIPLGVAAGVGAVAYVLAGHFATDGWPGPITLVPYAVLIAAAAQSDVAGETSRVLGSRPLVALGTWSFAFYLVHQAVIELLDPHLPASPAAARAVITLAVGTAAAYLLHRFVEQPWQRRLTERAPGDLLGRGDETTRSGAWARAVPPTAGG